ncbi:MAG: hypothetical protein DRO67_10505 [Candidatus Asgardarchaeum californiense]|nr:MAG: hypothetical protein DRO67_10505 [Candidatus Asgardarchaeum californiense]
MKNSIKVVLLVVLGVFLLSSFASAGTVYRTTINGVKFYTNKANVTQVYDKSWAEIEFDATAHAARLERDRKQEELFLKQKALEIKKLEAENKARARYNRNNITYIHYNRPYYYRQYHLRNSWRSYYGPTVDTSRYTRRYGRTRWIR